MKFYIPPTIKSDFEDWLNTDVANVNYDFEIIRDWYAQAAVRKIYTLKTQRLNVQDGTATAQNIDAQITTAERLVAANNQIIALLGQEAIARSKLVNLSAEEAALAQKLTNAQAVKQDKAAVDAQKAASGVNELKATQQAYSQLTNAYRQYNAAVKNGNEAG